MKYRPEIDGLRAVAVLPVVLYHAGLPFLPGGFVGVDIFFVISGFLITTILVQDHENGQYSILKFYERRARRILPALFLVVVASLPFAWAWLFPVQLREFGQSVVATAVFMSNFYFWYDQDYFSPGAEFTPMIHTWSLAIEEQFYIIFPLLLAGLWQFGRVAVFAVLVGIAAMSLGLAQYLSEAAPHSAFYLLPSRAWELMLGAIVAILMLRRRPDPNGFLAGIGLVMIAVAFGVIDNTTKHPSTWTLLPTVGTALIIMFSHGDGIVSKALRFPPMVFIGLISYSAYLWHQPLFAFARIRSIVEPPIEMMLLFGALSFVLAALTWKFVEQPFRTHAGQKSRLFPRRGPLLTASVVSIVIVGLAGASLHLSGGAPGRMPAAVERYVAAADDKNPLSKTCLQDAPRLSDLVIPPPPACMSNAMEDGNRAIILGDSHADAFAYPVRQVLEEAGWNVVELTIGGCPPMPGYTLLPRDCEPIVDRLYGYLEAEDFDLLVLGMRTQLLFGPYGFDNGEGGVEPVGSNIPKFTPEALGLPATASTSELGRVSIEAGMDKLLSLGGAVVVVHAVPEAGWRVPAIVARRAMYSNGAVGPLTTSRAAYEARAGEANAVLEGIDSPSLFHIRPADLLCDEQRCMNFKDGKIYYYDDDHLSLSGADLIANALRAMLPEISERH